MSIKGISNAQESVAKLSGISIASAGQLIVRGLGDRYSTTTLNGLPIASPNPDNKLIPLDIFPSSTIQNITVSKVYEASSFADYSGAHVDISTKEGADNEDFFNISFSTGGYFHTLSSDFYRMDGRSLFLTPSLDPAVRSMNSSEFEDFSRSSDIFGTSFRTYGRKPLPDLNGSFGLGRNFDLGGQTLSVLASASIKTGDETMTDAFYRTYEASSQGNLKSDYNYDSYKQKLDIAALADIDYTLRESDNIGFTAFFARNASDTHLDRRGFDYQETYDLVGSNQVTHIYTLQNYQLSGHHDLDAWDIDWGASYSLTSSDEPDRRQVMYRRGTDGQLRFFDLNQQETQRYFGSLDENELVADIKATYNFNESDRLRFGLTAKDKTRAFRTTRFYYNLRDLDEQISDVHNPDAYLNFENVSNGLITIKKSQYARDQYDALNLIGAAFVEADLHFGEKWQLNAGLRFEASRQSVDYNDDVEDLTRNLDAFDLFPAINLRYNIADRNMLRLSLSRTVTRPSFVEMAPFLYQESFGGLRQQHRHVRRHCLLQVPAEPHREDAAPLGRSHRTLFPERRERPRGRNRARVPQGDCPRPLRKRERLADVHQRHPPRRRLLHQRPQVAAGCVALPRQRRHQLHSLIQERLEPQPRPALQPSGPQNTRRRRDGPWRREADARPHPRLQRLLQLQRALLSEVRIQKPAGQHDTFHPGHTQRRPHRGSGAVEGRHRLRARNKLVAIDKDINPITIKNL